MPSHRKPINRCCRFYGVSLLVPVILGVLDRLELVRVPVFGAAVQGPWALMCIGGLLVAANIPIGRMIFLPAGIIGLALNVMVILFSFAFLGVSLFGRPAGEIRSDLLHLACLCLWTAYMGVGILLYALHFSSIGRRPPRWQIEQQHVDHADKRRTTPRATPDPHVP